MADRPSTIEREGAPQPGARSWQGLRRDAAADVQAIRQPHFSLLGAFAGWLSAWGVAALAAWSLIVAGVSLGLGWGFANARGVGFNDNFAPSLWLFIIQIGAFLFGGYVAGRMARNNAMLHAGLAWVLAMLATGADALVAHFHSGFNSVVWHLRIPAWADAGYGATWRYAAALAIFAGVSLIAALIGGSFAAGANKIDERRASGDIDRSTRTTDPVRTDRTHREEAPVAPTGTDGTAHDEATAVPTDRTDGTLRHEASTTRTGPPADRL